MEAHSVCPVKIYVGLMLYHCLRRRPNNKTTLGVRFVFDGITTVDLIVKCSTYKITNVNTQC